MAGYEQRGPHALKLRLMNRMEELEKLHEALGRFGGACGFTEDQVFRVSLACEEIVMNIITYGYPEGGEHEIVLTAESLPGEVRLTVRDDGRAFNPLEVQTPDTTLKLDERPVGGLGIHFVRRLMDEIRYSREEGINILQLTMRHEEEGMRNEHTP
ncbi:ATP-binding protein [Paenibacillus sp. IB182496]|uniref:ATP-binding protein n=1 Tax=Paenibacillus sabuli TaxID=2772509 RepID=A0A927GS22_9BACL|nr:ATP-binding protein [Paenibacillus sabuli]MBD2846093.1 ATP-binding protein [Paenibacillus sabuli]